MVRFGVGRYFKSSWVGMCRWDLGTLSLHQSYFSWILRPYSRVNSPNLPPPRVTIIVSLKLRSLALSSQNKTLYHNCFSVKVGFIYTCYSFRFSTHILVASQVTCWAMLSTLTYVLPRKITYLILTSFKTTYLHLNPDFWQLIMSSNVLWWPSIDTI